MKFEPQVFEFLEDCIGFLKKLLVFLIKVLDMYSRMILSAFKFSDECQNFEVFPIKVATFP